MTSVQPSHPPEPTLLTRWRAGLVRDLPGDVLEIGVGKGENLAYYRRARCVWAIEPDVARAEHARLSACHATVATSIQVAPVEALPYADSSFDHAVSSLVFCSVHDQRQALAELRRVLRPGGVLHMVEHVRPRHPLLAALFRAATPTWSRIAFNCHLDRPTVAVLRELGWHVEIHRRVGVFVRLSARP